MLATSVGYLPIISGGRQSVNIAYALLCKHHCFKRMASARASSVCYYKLSVNLVASERQEIDVNGVDLEMG